MIRMEPYIITIARETGSGGTSIAKKLSEAFNIPYYDRDLLTMASDFSGIDKGLFGKADERIGWKEMIFSAKKVYTGEILPPDDDDYISTRNLFSFQAKIIKDLAKSESCIVIGRCANYLLKDYPNVLRLFICAPDDARFNHLKEMHVAPTDAAIIKYMHKEDKRRSAYYHYYTGEEWRDIGGYDLCLDSHAYGVDGCAEIVKKIFPILHPGVKLG
jgi:cytidylate kinase